MKRDITEDIFDTIDEIEAKLHKHTAKVEKAIKKNAQLHIMIESGIVEEMTRKADRSGVTLSERCRNNLKDESQLDRIERKLNLLMNNYGK